MFEKFYRVVVNLKFKKVWITFVLALIISVWSKVYIVSHELNPFKLTVFLLVFAMIFVVLAIAIASSKDIKQKMEIRKNIFLGSLSILVSVCFGILTFLYILDKSKYDFIVQHLIMILFSIIACITFALISITFLTGKNKFISSQTLIFGPTLFYIGVMINFLTIANSNADPFDAAANSFILLFFVYHSNVFVKMSQKIMAKRVFVFGFSAIISIVCYNLLAILRYYRHDLELTNVALMAFFLNVLVGIYIYQFLIEYQKQQPTLKA